MVFVYELSFIDAHVSTCLIPIAFLENENTYSVDHVCEEISTDSTTFKTAWVRLY